MAAQIARRWTQDGGMRAAVLFWEAGASGGYPCLSSGQETGIDCKQPFYGAGA